MSQQLFNTKRWIEIALINFTVVALAGFTMRYKINFRLPFVNQRYLMHAHSNFAFVGWVAIALMVLMVRHLIRNKVETNYLKYNRILILDLIFAYGAFVAFIIQGYDFWSNTFSLVSILISYFFIYYYWKDLNKMKDHDFSASWWLKAGLVLWALSSAGAIWLAYLLANFVKVQDYYFAALYFFLHFQYNGWFLFVCFGIFFSYMRRLGLDVERKSKRLFYVMSILVIPSYFLSIFWLNLPGYMHWTANISGLCQIFILILFIDVLRKVAGSKEVKFHSATRWLWTLVCVAYIIKLSLMTLSIIPYLSHFAFGYRPVVIGYLHLSFVGVTSLFIFGYINEFIHRFKGRVRTPGAIIFVIGFVAQELILMFQGLEAMNVEPVKNANILLFYCAILMVIGLVWITYGIIKTSKTEYFIAPDEQK